jgi:hypothetical protein
MTIVVITGEVKEKSVHFQKKWSRILCFSAFSAWRAFFRGDFFGFAGIF